MLIDIPPLLWGAMIGLSVVAVCWVSVSVVGIVMDYMDKRRNRRRLFEPSNFPLFPFCVTLISNAV